MNEASVNWWKYEELFDPPEEFYDKLNQEESEVNESK